MKKTLTVIPSNKGQRPSSQYPNIPWQTASIESVHYLFETNKSQSNMWAIPC